MKYNFEGIGALGASLMAGALASSPLSFLVVGIPGKITFWLLTQLNSYLANKGLILLNVGVAKISAYSDRKDFDGTLESAIKIVIEHGDTLTEAEKRDIDDKVIIAFDKFSSFGELRDSRGS